MKRSTFSNVITYGIMLVVVVGTYMLNVFLLKISETEISTMALNSGETIPKASSGASVYLLLRIRQSCSRSFWRIRWQVAAETLRSHISSVTTAEILSQTTGYSAVW